MLGGIIRFPDSRTRKNFFSRIFIRRTLYCKTVNSGAGGSLRVCSTRRRVSCWLHWSSLWAPDLCRGLCGSHILAGATRCFPGRLWALVQPRSHLSCSWNSQWTSYPSGNFLPMLFFSVDFKIYLCFSSLLWKVSNVYKDRDQYVDAHSVSFSDYQGGPNMFHLYFHSLSSTPGYFKANLKYNITSTMNILVCISKRAIF